MPWDLRTPDAWRQTIGDRPVVSAEADRLEGLTGLISDFPCATDLLRLTPDQLQEPPEPLYLHPAVQG
jgi:hypothetical protein